jgi:hypothetical protein
VTAKPVLQQIAIRNSVAMRYFMHSPFVREVMSRFP